MAGLHRLASGLAGLTASVLGFLLAALAAGTADPVLGLVAGAVLGAGYGYGLTLAFGLTEVGRLAPPEHLARLTALLWTLAYLGMFAPYVITLLSGAVTVPLLLVAAAVLAALSCAAVPALDRRALAAPNP